MPDITAVPANFTSVVLESFLYGFLVLLFISTIYFLVNRRTLAGDKQSVKHHFLSLPFLGVALLFFLVTVHWSIVLWEGYFAFIHLGTFALEDGFYADLAQPSVVMKETVVFITLILGDSLVIYRLWIVWAHNGHIVLFPIFATAGSAVSSLGLVIVFTRWTPILRGTPFDRSKDPWAIPGLVLSFLTNVYSTGLIIYRIRSVSKTAKAAAGHSLMHFLSILAESAALQTLWLTLTALVMFLKSDVQFFFLDCFPAIVGISNMLIHARVGLGWSQYSADPPKAPRPVEVRSTDNDTPSMRKEIV